MIFNHIWVDSQFHMPIIPTKKNMYFWFLHCENLEKYYINAKFIIAPIFDGSGMKTKIAEAMMYGKKVIGTTEAFVGYEDHLPEAGWLCNSKVEFVQSIMSSNEGLDNQGLNNNLRKIFQANYSLESAEIKMRNILSN